MTCSTPRLVFLITVAALLSACPDDRAKSGGGKVRNSANCPTRAPGAYQRCKAAASDECDYKVSCQSGEAAIRFVCKSGYWRVAPDVRCAHPYDSCPSGLYCGDKTWGLPLPRVSDPAASCLDTMPKPGAECSYGGLGSSVEKCGYRCSKAAGAKWTVATCVPPHPPKNERGVRGKWTFDGACGNDGPDASP